MVKGGGRFVGGSMFYVKVPMGITNIPIKNK